MKPTTKDADPAALSAVSAEVTIDNRLPPRHPQRIALERALRSALVGLTGAWAVVVERPSELSLVIAVVAPDGSAWTMSCCDPDHRDPEAIAEIVRAACNRRRRLGPSPPMSSPVRDSGGNRT